MPQRMPRIALVVILGVAAAARFWFLNAGVPHAAGPGEPEVIGRVIRILHTGDWNPHFFDYPSLAVYLHAGVAIARFLWGALQGEWSSLDAFTIEAIYGAGRLAAALIGVTTVYLTYRLARELVARPVALLAAAQLAVLPLHVRESHFILPDVPMTALSALAVWLALRAVRRHEVGAYAWAGAACGLAAAAQYTGAFALLAPLAAWAVQERRHPQRDMMLGALVGAAAVAFVAGAPFTVLDMPAFLDGFAAQISRFAAPSGGGTPWPASLKYLSPGWPWLAIPLTLAGAAILLGRRDSRRAALPLIVFTLGYISLVFAHSHAPDRSALPLLPILCVLSSTAAVRGVEYVARLRPLHRAPRPLLAAAAVVLLLWVPVAETVGWLDQYKRLDTRGIAAAWLKGNTPKGTPVAVEHTGPTHLDAAGLRVTTTDVLLDHPLEWYRTRADYLVISAADLSRYGEYTAAGPIVLQIGPTSQRSGPSILIVRLSVVSRQ